MPELMLIGIILLVRRVNFLPEVLRNYSIQILHVSSSGIMRVRGSGLALSLH